MVWWFRYHSPIHKKQHDFNNDDDDAEELGFDGAAPKLHTD